MVFLQAAKVIVAGIAVSAISGAGVGIGAYFSALFSMGSAVFRNPGLTNQLFSYAILRLGSTLWFSYLFFSLGIILVIIVIFIKGTYNLVFRCAFCDDSTLNNNVESSEEELHKRYLDEWNIWDDIQTPLEEWAYAHPGWTLVIIVVVTGLINYYGEVDDDE